MKSILLIGLGRFGRHIAMKLNDLNHQVMAVDRNEERINSSLSFVTNAQIGDSTNEEFLSSLGIRNFDACIVAIGDDFQNSLETTSLLKELGAKKVIARASTGVQEKFLLRNGADKDIFPERSYAEWTAIRYANNHVLDYLPLGDDFVIMEVEVPESWRGRSVRDLKVRSEYGLNIIALRSGEVTRPNVDPDEKLTAEENLVVFGRPADIRRCFRIV